MATPSLNFCRGEGKEANSLRSDKPPSFFLPATEIQGAIKGRKVKGQTGWAQGERQGVLLRWLQVQSRRGLLLNFATIAAQPSGPSRSIVAMFRS